MGLIFFLFIFLLIFGTPIVFSLGIAATLTLMAYDVPLALVAQRMFGGLDKFSEMTGGVLLGASRKSFIGFLTGDGDRLTGSLAAAMIGATANVDLVRVHDVKETRKAIDTINALN